MIAGSVTCDRPRFAARSIPWPLLLTALWLVVGPPDPSLACGADRWDVKTLADGETVFGSPISEKIDDLGLIQHEAIQKHTPRLPFETRSYAVQADVVEFKLEPDEDYHLVLRSIEPNGLSDQAATMIGEIPAPDCAQGGAKSPLGQRWEALRSQLNSMSVTKEHGWHIVNQSAVVVGIGFFDLTHSTPQTGHAPNNVEIHPIMGIAWRGSASARAPAIAALHSLVASEAHPRAAADGFAIVSEARRSCPGSQIVWVSPLSGVYHIGSSLRFGHTPHGSYMCLTEARRLRYEPANND
jgi:hypothetical protein